MMGSKLFGLGCAASFVLGNNPNYAQQLAVWDAQGMPENPPRFAVFYVGAAYGCVKLSFVFIMCAKDAQPDLVSIYKCFFMDGFCRYKLIGCRPNSWYWWGGVLYLCGNVQYNIASTCSFAHNFPQQYATWSADAVKWLVTVMYTSGGGFYLLAGLFYILTDTGSQFWRGKILKGTAAFW